MLPTIEMLRAGYNIFVVDDCCGATSVAPRKLLYLEWFKPGAVRLTTIPALLEWYRDWANGEITTI